jgi:hypothetical protein
MKIQRGYTTRLNKPEALNRVSLRLTAQKKLNFISLESDFYSLFNLLVPLSTSKMRLLDQQMNTFFST